MSNCGACGASLVAGTSFCGACGAHVDGGKKPETDLGFVCPECHQFNDAGASACRSCGSSLVPSGFTGFLRAASIPPTPAPAAPAASRPAPAAPRPAPAAPHVAVPGPGTEAFGPLQPGRAKLVLIRGRGYQGAEFRLNSEEVAVGRSRGFVLFPEDPHLSETQTTLRYKEGRLYLRDEGGHGGSWLRIREPVALRANAEIAIGDTRLKVQELAPIAADTSRQFGAPRAEEAFRIEERLTGDRPGRAWVCRGEVVTIGNAGATVSIEGDPLVAGRHAEIRRVGPRWVLADAGTPEGTFVRVAPGVNVPLRDQDRLRIGSQVLEVRVAG